MTCFPSRNALKTEKAKSEYDILMKVLSIHHYLKNPNARVSDRLVNVSRAHLADLCEKLDSNSIFVLNCPISIEDEFYKNRRYRSLICGIFEESFWNSYYGELVCFQNSKSARTLKKHHEKRLSELRDEFLAYHGVQAVILLNDGWGKF